MEPRFVRSNDEEFTWQCSLGHWNKGNEWWCRTCHEAKPEQADEAQQLLREIAREHPRSEK